VERGRRDPDGDHVDGTDDLPVLHRQITAAVHARVPVPVVSAEPAVQRRAAEQPSLLDARADDPRCHPGRAAGPPVRTRGDLHRPRHHLLLGLDGHLLADRGSVRREAVTLEKPEPRIHPTQYPSDSSGADTSMSNTSIVVDNVTKRFTMAHNKTIKKLAVNAV